MARGLGLVLGWFLGRLLVGSGRDLATFQPGGDALGFQAGLVG
jgi:hypothetical protein